MKALNVYVYVLSKSAVEREKCIFPPYNSLVCLLRPTEFIF